MTTEQGRGPDRSRRPTGPERPHRQAGPERPHRQSAGLLLFRDSTAGLQVLLGHMGGPFWARRDAGAWSIPKGEYSADEAPLAAARREFTEELGLPPPAGAYLDLGSVTQAGGKVVTVWAVAGDLDPAGVEPGTFTMQWPPGSGVLREFPELDRVAWVTPDHARRLLVRGQVPLLDRLLDVLAAPGPAGP